MKAKNKKKKKEKKKEEEKKKKSQSKLVLDQRGALGFRPFVVNLLLVSIIMLCIVEFIVFFMMADAPSNPLLVNLTASSVPLQNMLNTFNTTATQQAQRMANASANPVGFVFLIFQGAFDIPQAIFSAVTAVPSLITGLLFPSLAATGLGGMVNLLFGVMGGIIMITLVLLTVKVIRSGESER